MMNREVVQLSRKEPLEIGISIPSAAHTSPVKPLTPKLPCPDLIKGPRRRYNEICVPLYEASISGDWKSAKAILDKNQELVRYSITENGETVLHVAGSAKRSKKMEEFVQNVVDLMRKEDLALENEDGNTALYLAASTGNIETVKILVEKNKTLLIKISDDERNTMPLYAAALFGYYDVVKYLYEYSHDLLDDGWTPENRGWLLEKCVEGDMFDIALRIVGKHRKLGIGGSLLAILARKPDAFLEKKSNIIWRTINSVFRLIGLKVGDLEKEINALPLLRIIWEDISEMPKEDIDVILRGPPDLIKQEKSTSRRVIQAMKLQKLIFERLKETESRVQSIVGGKSYSTEQHIYLASSVDHVQLLKDLIDEHLMALHDGSEQIYPNDKELVYEKRDLSLELKELIYEHIMNMKAITKDVNKSVNTKAQMVSKLQNMIVQNIEKMRYATFPKERYYSRIMFIAAEMGNTKFVVELIRGYPDIIMHVNDHNRSIFHVAVQHRREDIYNLLYEIGSMKNLITTLEDEDENNMLHLAAYSTQQKLLEGVSGTALQMQRELLWFKEVESMIPPTYRDRKNKDGLTPYELFTMEHKVLITKGETWMKETASQCMVVATLIATIVFAAAFTVPGGYNQNDGIPIFYQKLTFVVFVVADAISLFLSSTSILTFLSILTSRYAERDFIASLPNKLMLGLSTLFLSITTMMIAFSVSFFVLYNEEMKWIPVLIGLLAISPVLLYVALQYHLLIDVIRSTYGSKYLFKPLNQVLYYERKSSYVHMKTT